MPLASSARLNDPRLRGSTLSRKGSRLAAPGDGDTGRVARRDPRLRRWLTGRRRPRLRDGASVGKAAWRTGACPLAVRLLLVADPAVATLNASLERGIL
jgi:hypothetical protein